MRDLGPDRGIIVQFLLDHLGLKLVALALAIALFALVRCETETVRTVHLDIVAELPPLSSRRVLVSELPDRVEVQLRGPSARLDALHLAELSPIRLDLRRDGIAAIDLSKRVDVSDPVHVVRVQPNVVRLEWRPRAERLVPVRLELDESPPSGLALRSLVRVEPTHVRVTGPADELAQLQHVASEAVPVGELSTGTFQLPVPLRPLPGHLAYAHVTSVTVRLEVGQEPDAELGGAGRP